MDFVRISCLTCDNFELPFIYLLWKLLKDTKIDLEVNILNNQISEDLDSEIINHIINKEDSYIQEIKENKEWINKYLNLDFKNN